MGVTKLVDSSFVEGSDMYNAIVRYIGFMPSDEISNIEASNVKNILDTWYNENISNYSKYISEEIWEEWDKKVDKLMDNPFVEIDLSCFIIFYFFKLLSFSCF